MATLAHTIVRAEGKNPTRSLLFLHGILGTRANWRGIARKLVDQRPELAVVLVDLRGHGDSLGMPGPSTVEQAARDLRALEAVLEIPVRGALGHSFGGKVAMQYALDRTDPLDTLFVIDSAPGRERGPDGEPEPPRIQETAQILRTLRELTFPMATREDFVAAIEAAGLSRSIALWLAMNLRRMPDGRRDFPLDLNEVENLLASVSQHQRQKNGEQTVNRMRARTLNAKSPLVYLSLGTIALAAADWQLARHQPAERDLADGLVRQRGGDFNDRGLDSCVHGMAFFKIHLRCIYCSIKYIPCESLTLCAVGSYRCRRRD